MALPGRQELTPKTRTSGLVAGTDSPPSPRGRLLGLLAAVLFAISTAPGQQPATQTSPIFATNAKYVQGVGPGYWPTAGTGLTLNLAAGTAFCGGSIRTYAGGALIMPASSTTYVYLDTTNNCAPASNTTGFSATTIPIAVVITNASSITSITDDRTFFFSGGSGGGSGGTVTSVGLTTPAWLSVAGSPVTASGTLAVTAAGSQTSHQVIGTGVGSSFGPITLTPQDLPQTSVTAVTNDTNVTGSINAQSLALGWTGQLPLARGGTGASTAAGAWANLVQAPTATTLGGIESLAQTNHNWVNYIDTNGVPHQSQPGCSDLSNSSGGCSMSTTAAGDLTGTLPSPTVAKVNGGSVPASATVLGSNSSSQIVAATTTGSGTTVPLAMSPSIATPSLGSPSLGAGSSPITETWTVGTGGVTANTLVQTDTSAPSKVIAASTGVYGIAQSTVSAGGNVEVARYGTVSCVTDTGGSTAGDLAIIGTGTVVDCKDSGQTSSSAIAMTARIVGVFRSSATAGSAALVELTPSHYGTQAVTAFSGDGTLITNNGAIGTVAATLGNAGAQQFWAGPPAWGAPAAAPTYRALTPRDVPAGLLSCAIHDNAICTSSVDAAGNPNFLSAGSGATVNINGAATPLVYFVNGTYQVINSNLAVTVATPGADTLYFIIIKLDTSTANPVSGDLVASNQAPVYQYSAPTCPSSGISSSNPSVWFDLSTNLMKWCTSNGGGYSAQPSIVLGEALVSATPSVVAVLAEPYRLNPYMRFQLFGNGSSGAQYVTNSATASGFLGYSVLTVDGGSLCHNASGQGQGAYYFSQNPVILTNNGAINCNGVGLAGKSVGTGAGQAGNNGGLWTGGGGGGGGAGATNAGGTGGNYALLMTIAQFSATGGGSAGSAGNAGGNGTSFTSATAWFATPTFLGVGPSGGNGGGDGTNNGGQGGTGGGTFVLRAPSVLVASGSSATCNGNNGAAGAAGNAGGGGGGGGGSCFIFAGFVTNGTGSTYAPTATGGSGGAGQGTGKSGGSGGSGNASAVKMW